VTSFFKIKGAFSRKRQDESVPNFFQGFGENICLLQLALKNNKLGLYGIVNFCQSCRK